MSFRAIDADNDWVFGSGVQSYATLNLAIKYDIQTKLQTFLTECFFDQEIGVPWFQLLGAKNADALILSIKTIIINVEGVTKIESLSFFLDENREAHIKYVIDTIYTTQFIGSVII